MSIVGLLAAIGAPTAVAAAPANDNFAAAAELSDGIRVMGDTTEATHEAGEPEHAPGNYYSHSVWFKWTATAGGTVKVDTCGSAFDTVLAVYAGNSVAGLFATRVTNDAGSCQGNSSMLFFTAQAGTTYRIAVDGMWWNPNGPFSIGLDALGGSGPPPPNDLVGNAVTLAGVDADVTGTNVDATNEWNEWGSTQTVWWHWRAPTDGQVAIDTCGSLFDTRLEVSAGEDYATSQSIAFSDDAGDACQDRSRVQFNGHAGTLYWISVGGDEGAAGDVAVSLRGSEDLTPPETTITSGPASSTGLRWADFTWTANEEARFECQFDDSDWLDCNGLNRWEALTDGPHSFRLRAIDVYGNVDPTPAEWLWSVDIPAAPNDMFANAQTLTTGEQASINTGKATAEDGEPGSYVAYPTARRSVWYGWTAPGSGIAELDTCGSEFDVGWSLYTGTSLTDLARIAHGSSENDGTSSCSDHLTVEGGTRYWIGIDGVARNDTYGNGPLKIKLSMVDGAAPTNDDFAGATQLSGADVETVGANAYASEEPGEPASHGTRSVWWRWTSPGDGAMTVTTCGSEFDTRLAVYTGTAVAALALEGAADDSPYCGDAAAVTVPVSAGNTYSIAVGSATANGGALSLGLFFTPAAEPPPGEPPPSDTPPPEPPAGGDATPGPTTPTAPADPTSESSETGAGQARQIAPPSATIAPAIVSTSHAANASLRGQTLRVRGVTIVCPIRCVLHWSLSAARRASAKRAFAPSGSLRLGAGRHTNVAVHLSKRSAARLGKARPARLILRITDSLGHSSRAIVRFTTAR